MFRRILDLRELANLTQKQVADQIKCSQQVYSDYERGNRNFPVDTLIALSQLYHVSTDYILGLSDKK